METITNLYKSVYDILNNNQTLFEEIEGRIFSNIPENTRYPLVKISSINNTNIACADFQGIKSIVKLEIISKSFSNLECLKLVDNISKIFRSSHGLDKETSQELSKAKVLSSSVFQDESFWTGQLELEISSFTKH